MDSAEFAEYLTERSPDDPYYETLILDFGTSRPAWWACNHCGNEINPNAGGCPDHAPRNVPGLYRVDCPTNPAHGPVWVVDGDHTGYGVPCWQCMYHETATNLAKARKTDRCYHRPWRRWALTKWAASHAYRLGLVAGYGTGTGGGCDWCLSGFHMRGERPYILGASRNTWRCWLRGRHRRGEEVGFGFCGKCVPWPCCGSQTVEHVTGCVEGDEFAGRAVAS